MRVALGSGQGLALDQRIAHAGRALEAFVGGRNDRFRSNRRQVDIQRAERAHCIDDEFSPRCCDGVGDFRQRVEDTGGRFAMDEDDM